MKLKTQAKLFVNRLKTLSVQEQYEALKNLPVDMYVIVTLLDEGFKIGHRIANLKCTRCTHKASSHGRDESNSKCAKCDCLQFAADNLTWIEQDAQNNLTKERN
jgi:hypothetical protein